MPYIVYILECSDGSYYTGSTDDLNKRLWQHEQGLEPSSYTYSRRPVKLMWTSEQREHYYDALRWERQIKGWSRAKKEGLIRGDFDALHEIVKSERKQREQHNRKPPRCAESGCFSARSRSASKYNALDLLETCPSTSFHSAQAGIIYDH